MSLKIKSHINALRKHLELITEPDMFILKKIQLFQSNYDLFSFFTQEQRGNFQIEKWNTCTGFSTTMRKPQH